MLTNVLEYLEGAFLKCPEKTAYANESEELTFGEVYRHSRSIGSFLYKNGFYHEPVAVYMEKHPDAIETFYGVVYAGCWYVPIDEEMPKYRVDLILKTLKPRAIICDAKTAPAAGDLSPEGRIFLHDELIAFPSDDIVLSKIRSYAIDADPLYIVFTSGSTGVPKGVAACHRSVIDYIEHLSDILKVDQDTVFGNQTPLYFDACLKELYPTLKYGATAYLIPKQLFMFPVKLVEFLNEKKINTICWVVSALTMISAVKTFNKVKPLYLKTVAFGSEVFPIKQFNIWKEALPEADFINLYGPTEATGMSCYYRVDREFSLDEVIPIGRPFPNTDIFLLGDDGQKAEPGEPGEICIRGTGVTLGYYRDPERTSEAYVQNPLQDDYPEIIYKTGDIGRVNERGELVFLSRKDSQIKHMGHRIELGEIETVSNMQKNVNASCCVFDEAKKKIILFYTGEEKKEDMVMYLKEKLPRYMVPNVTRKLEDMPYTPNGKIDRNLLKNAYKDKHNF